MPGQALPIIHTFLHFKPDAKGKEFLTVHHSFALVVIAVNELNIMDNEALLW